MIIMNGRCVSISEKMILTHFEVPALSHHFLRNSNENREQFPTEIKIELKRVSCEGIWSEAYVTRIEKLLLEEATQTMRQCAAYFPHDN
jgi:hypothetical protein